MSWVPRIGVVGVAAAGLVAAGYGQSLLAGRIDVERGTPLLLAGCLVAVAMIAVARRMTPPQRWSEAPWMLEAAAVVALLALGAWLRLTGFDRIPAGMNHDGAWNGMYATYIRGGAEYTPYVAAAWGRETLFMYLIAVFQHWLGGTAAAVQAAAITAGLAALIPLYLLVRELFGRGAGLVGLAFFAVSGWHWVFSKVGWRCVTVTPFEALALFFVWRALRRGGAVAWLAAGVFTASTIYTYNAARIAPAMIGFLALWYLAFHRDRWWPILRGGMGAAVAFAVAGGPMLWYAANNWVKWQGRAEHLLGESGRETSVLQNMSDALWMFNYRGNGNDFFVNEPLLEPLAAVLFAIGAGVLLTRIRRANAQFVLVGFLLSLIPGLLSFPNGNRCVTAMPFVYAMIGVGGFETARLLASLWSGAAARWATAVLLAACVGQAATSTYATYVSEQRRPLIGVSPEATAVGEYLGRFGDDYRVYAVSDLWPHYTLMYLGFTGGNPLEPGIVIGRSLAEIESQISRYGRKGLVLVGDLTPAGVEARAGIKRLFAESREESVTASRLGGSEVARAVVVEPRAASRTAPWSNLTRVLAVAAEPGEAAAKGARCFDARSTAAGLSVRLRLMVPNAPPPSAGAVELVSSCPSGDAVVRFAIAADGLVVDGPQRRVLVAPAELQAGRWYDLGLVIDALGNTGVSVDGQVVELGRWDSRPGQIAGFAVDVAGDPEGSPSLYVDDFATAAKAMPNESPWWQVAPSLDDPLTSMESFEGMPLGDLAGRPGWHDEGVQWSIHTGPTGPGLSAVVGANAFDGGPGKGPGNFDEPMGVGIDARGNIYVSERLNHRVQKFAADGTYLGEWGVLGEQPGEFREPLDLAVDGDRVYVMDTWNTRLQVFDLTGNYLFQIGPDPMLGKPRGIFVRDGKVYIANSGRDNIVVFDTAGKQLAAFPPPESSTLKQIVDLVVDSQGRIYVNNSENNRLEIFSPAGERLGAIAIPGWDSPYLKEFYMTIDDDDVIYISDWDAHRVRRFRVDGSELPAIGPPMNRPSGLARHGDRVVVAARGDNALRVIDLALEAAQ